MRVHFGHRSRAAGPPHSPARLTGDSVATSTCQPPALASRAPDFPQSRHLRSHEVSTHPVSFLGGSCRQDREREGNGKPSPGISPGPAQPTPVGRLPAPPAVQGDTGDPVSLVAGGTREGKGQVIKRPVQTRITNTHVYTALPDHSSCTQGADPLGALATSPSYSHS